MIQVVGPWGAGTSLVAAVLAANGCEFSDCLAATTEENERRAPLGLFEHRVLAAAHRKGESIAKAKELTCLGFSQILIDAQQRGKRPAAKLPGLIFSKPVWPLWIGVTSGTVIVERPSKDYTADPLWINKFGDDRFEKAQLIDQHVIDYDALHRLWTDAPIYRLVFEELVNQPELIIPEMCMTLRLRYNPKSVALVDKSQPLQKVADSPPPGMGAEATVAP